MKHKSKSLLRRVWFIASIIKNNSDKHSVRWPHIDYRNIFLCDVPKTNKEDISVCLCVRKNRHCVHPSWVSETKHWFICSAFVCVALIYIFGKNDNNNTKVIESDNSNSNDNDDVRRVRARVSVKELSCTDQESRCYSRRARSFSYLSHSLNFKCLAF